MRSLRYNNGMRRIALSFFLLFGMTLTAESLLKEFDYNQPWDLLIINLSTAIAMDYIGDYYVLKTSIMAAEDLLRDKPERLTEYANRDRITEDISEKYNEYFWNDKVPQEHSFIIVAVASNQIYEFIRGASLSAIDIHEKYDFQYFE